MGALRGGALTAGIVYLAGTALAWLGWGLVFRALWLALRLGLNQRAAPARDLLWSALGAGLALGAGSTLTSAGAAPVEPGWRLPLVWPVLPVLLWVAVAGAVGVVTRTVQAAFALTRLERRDRLRAAAAWALLGIGAAGVQHVFGNAAPTILRGEIPLRPAVVAALLAFAVAGMLAMELAARAARTRAVGQTLATHAALLAGSVVFGLPFAFLLVTSFKEDRDMASPTGIVWVPRVQKTVSYRDPNRPQFRTRHQGQWVEGIVLGERPDGAIKLEVLRPLALRGSTLETRRNALTEIPRAVPLVSARFDGATVQGMVIEELEDGRRKIRVLEPPALKGRERIYEPAQLEPVREVGLRWQNYTEALSFLPPETRGGLVYLRNTLLLVVLGVVGTLISSSLAAYAFARMRFPGRDLLFGVLLASMMLPGAVTLLPQFLIFRSLGWIDTLLPIWVPAFLGSAFNIFMLRQFFRTVPMELEDAAKIDGCGYFRAFWSVMLPQVKPALAAIAVWTFMGAWNNFMGPLIYVNSPERMPLSYALSLFMGDRANEPGLLMAFTTLTILPVLALFLLAQRYFIEGVTLTGFGGK